MMRRLVVAALGAVLAATLVTGGSAPAGAGAVQAEQPLYGIVLPRAAPLRGSLVRLEPRTLAPQASPRVGLGRFYQAVGRSPDGTLLALVDQSAPALRIVDLARMRTLGDVRLQAPRGWRVRTAAWLTADRLVVLLQGNRGAYGSIVAARQVLVVDPLARRVLARRAFADTAALTASAPAGDKLVLLLGRGDLAGGSVRLVVVASDGSVTNAGVVDRGPGRERRTSSLVVDPAGSRALVVTAGAPIADLDLRTMRLESRPVAGRFLERRGMSIRNALWIDERTIAVSGYDYTRVGRETRATGSGLALVDTERWTARVVEPTAGIVAYAGGLLLVSGTPEATGGRTERGRGLTAYGLDGTRRWHAFGTEFVSVQPLRGLARVFFAAPRLAAPGREPGDALVELASGRVLPSRADVPGSNLYVLPEPPAPERARQATVGGTADVRVDGAPLLLHGDGLALTGTARADVARVVVVRADGAELELELDADGGFAYEAGGAEHAARTLRAESAGRGVLSTLRLAEPGCGGAAGPCPQATAAPTGPASFALLHARGSTVLAQVDPATLRALPGRTVRLAGERYLAARSPDGRRLALPGATAWLDVIDLERLRPLVPVWRPAPGWSVRAVGWLTNERLAAVVQRMRRGSVAARALVVLDTTASRVVARRPLTRTLAIGQAVAAGGRFAVLLRSSDHRGSTVRLVVADARGNVRAAELEVGRTRGVLNGTTLTVEPDGSRAYVFPSAIVPLEPTALAVELDTLRSTRHPIRLEGSAPLRPGLVRVVPAAAAQVAPGRAAVTDLFPLGRGVAAGVFLVDTQRFTARLVDARARSFAAAGRRLYTFGRGNDRGSVRGTGVAAYDLDGRRAYHVYGDRSFERLVLAGGYGHALPGGRERRRAVFAADDGRGVGTLPPLPRGFEPVPDAPAPQPLRLAGTDDGFTIGNRGEPVATTPETRRLLRRMGLGDVRAVHRLAVRGGRGFYRLGRRNGIDCYASGRAEEPGMVGTAACPSGFPSRARPVLDFTGVELSRDGTVRILRVEGIAADAVASLEIVDRSGAVVATAPVEDNVYVLPPPPPGATALLARSADGEVVLRRSFAPQRPIRPALRGASAYGVRLAHPPGWHSAVYRPRAGSAVGPVLMVASIGLPPFRRVEDVAAAARRLGPDGVVLLLGEAGAGRGEDYPALREPLALRPPFRATPRGAEKIVNFSVEGRLLQLVAFFGSPRVEAETLRETNAILATLRVAHVPTPRGAPLQQGEADGVTVGVYRNLVLFRFASADSRAYRLVAGSDVGAGCSRFRSAGSAWIASGSAVLKPFARELAVTLGPRPPRAPFDGCEVSSSHGRRWNDARGNHAAVEIAFTDRARRFFEERAVARDLALFVRSPVLDDVRRAMRRGGRAPSAAAVARRVGTRIVPLAHRAERPPAGAVGVWSDGGAVLEASEVTPRGRRLHVTIRAGRIGGHNVHGLAFVF